MLLTRACSQVVVCRVYAQRGLGLLSAIAPFLLLGFRCYLGLRGGLELGIIRV